MDININKIYIIVHKNEKDCFNFEVKSREWDGFVLFLDGKGVAKDKNGNKFSINCGDLILLQKGESYSLYFNDGCSYITSAFDFLEESRNSIDKLPFKFTCSSNQILHIKNMCELWQSRTFDAYTACRINLLSLYLDIIKQQRLATTQSKEVNMAKEYIHNNFKTNFSSNEIAKYCHISPSYLRSKFSKETNLSITEYRDNLRILSAKEMLKSKHFTIEEISNDLGFYDVYHFSKRFKKIVGIPPAKYSKES